MDIMFIILWAIQTLTESLPISSSTHVKLYKHFLKVKNIKYFNNYFNETFEYLMHSSSLIIFTTLIFQKLILLKNINFYQLFLLALISNFFTGIFYLILKKINKKKFPISLGLLITCLMLFSFYFYKENNINLNIYNNFTYKDIYISIIIGIFQGIALLPGISRLATTLTVGAWLGWSLPLTFLFSCILQCILIILSLLKSLFKVNDLNKFIHLIDFKTILFVILSMLLGYSLLILSFKIFINSKIYYFGYYILILLFIRQKII